MHPPVAADPEDGFALRPDRRPSISRKARPARAASGFPWLRLTFGCGATIAVLACLVERQDLRATNLPGAPVRLAMAGAPPPVWTPVPRPLSIYGLDAPQLKRLPVAFTARRDAAGAREDILTFGAFDRAAEPHLRLILHRSPDPEQSEPSLFLALARQASHAGLAVTRSMPAAGLATKFGVMEISEAILSDTAERACIAFRFAHQEIGFRLAGWLCPARGQENERQELACTLDRLSLAEAGNDEQLKRLFAQADRQRLGGCAPVPLAGTVERSRGEGRPVSRSASGQARPRAQGPVTAAQRGSATLRRAPARGAGSASPDNRG
jgi:hypothetical protein